MWFLSGDNDKEYVAKTGNNIKYMDQIYGREWWEITLTSHSKSAMM